MKVLETRDALLSDYEVLQFLSKLERHHHWDEESTLSHQKNQRKKIKTHRPYNHPELQAITKDTISYLTTNKGAQQDENPTSSPISRLNDERFSELVRNLNQYSLFKAEKLHIVNQLPQSLVHLYSVVEECDSRFTQEQLDAILASLNAYI
ncbi:related to DNA-directed RNA polymerase III subunit RPC9 [Zygosaccharomyces bailii]|nr:related to DNA-directed RNA polymerase III subunit RPC9 [Zygosaccharomyces bailii]